jgi:hypothetical protein
MQARIIGELNATIGIAATMKADSAADADHTRYRQQPDHPFGHRLGWPTSTSQGAQGLVHLNIGIWMLMVDSARLSAAP